MVGRGKERRRSRPAPCGGRRSHGRYPGHMFFPKRGGELKHGRKWHAQQQQQQPQIKTVDKSCCIEAEPTVLRFIVDESIHGPVQRIRETAVNGAHVPLLYYYGLWSRVVHRGECVCFVMRNRRFAWLCSLRQ